MAARSCSRADAYDWLEQRLTTRSHIEVDFDRLIEQPAEQIKTPDEAPQTDAESGDRRLKFLGRIWRYGDPVRRPQRMLIPVALPDVCFHGLFLGQRSTYKSFLLNSVAIAVASGGAFAGQQVLRRGLVVQIEFEGSSSDLRLMAAARKAGITEKLPIVVIDELPPTVLVNKRETCNGRGMLRIWHHGQKMRRSAGGFRLGLSVLTR